MTHADDLAAFLSGFHSIALAAYVEVAVETGQWPPDSESVRKRAYDLYEAELQRCLHQDERCSVPACANGRRQEAVPSGSMAARQTAMDGDAEPGATPRQAE